jgi:hypothetical protein
MWGGRRRGGEEEKVEVGRLTGTQVALVAESSRIHPDFYVGAKNLRFY